MSTPKPSLAKKNEWPWQAQANHESFSGMGDSSVSAREKEGWLLDGFMTVAAAVSITQLPGWRLWHHPWLSLSPAPISNLDSCTGFPPIRIQAPLTIFPKHLWHLSNLMISLSLFYFTFHYFILLKFHKLSPRSSHLQSLSRFNLRSM